MSHSSGTQVSDQVPWNSAQRHSWHSKSTLHSDPSLPHLRRVLHGVITSVGICTCLLGGSPHPAARTLPAQGTEMAPASEALPAAQRLPAVREAPPPLGCVLIPEEHFSWECLLFSPGSFSLCPRQSCGARSCPPHCVPSAPACDGLTQSGRCPTAPTPTAGLSPTGSLDAVVRCFRPGRHPAPHGKPSAAQWASTRSCWPVSDDCTAMLFHSSPSSPLASGFQRPFFPSFVFF